MHFFHTPEWRDVQRRSHRACRTFSANGTLRHAYRHDLALGFHYWYVPRAELQTMDSLRAAARACASVPGALFLRVEPLATMRNEDMGYSVYPAPSLQPQATSIVDLAKSPEALLRAMNPKTRYNIALARRHGVRVRKYTPRHAREFFQLLRGTVERDGFSAHPRSHYEHLLAVKSPTFTNELYIARLGLEPVAAAIVNFHRGRATYLHGASDYSRRNLMAPHALHWAVMQDAKKRGATAYDFWGIDEKRFPGVTRFKRSFGGEDVSYPSAIDIVFHPWLYAMYQSRHAVFGAIRRLFHSTSQKEDLSL